MNFNRLLLLLALAASLGFAPGSARAQVSEAAVKAAFLPKIVRYIDWPARAVAPGAPLQICIVGSDPFGRLIDEAIAGQTLGDHAMSVRRGGSLDGCQVAFLAGSVAPRAIAVLKGRPVLTVTDSRGGTTRGMIHFAPKGPRVSFHIDDAQAAQSGLGISARLLAIALSVRSRSQ
jgi:hypothetical protein